MEKTLLSLLFLFISNAMFALDAGDVFVNDIYYHVDEEGVASVIRHPSGKYSGDLVILESIPYDGKMYVVDRISKSAFYGCDELTSITIPRTIKYISSYAFENCYQLSAVYITDLVAWCNIEYLDQIGYPYNPLYYAHRLFLNGTLIEDLVIPEGATSIGEFAFYRCWLNSVTIPDNVTSIGDYAFYASTLNSVTISNHVTSIGYRVFKYCSNLASVKIPGSVTSIGDEAFQNCSELTTVTFSENLDHIGKGAFQDCRKLTSVTLPNPLDTIADNLFRGCYQLSSLSLPDEITHIGWFAFLDCPRLQSITIPKNLKSIGACAFYGCSRLESVYISDLSAWCEVDFTECLYSYYSSGMYYVYDTELYRSNPLCANDNVETCLYLNGEKVRDLVIPEGTEQIKNGAFSCFSTLESITIPNGVKTIGKRAFEKCKSLKQVVIGNGMEMLGEEAFLHCSQLSKVTLGGVKGINAWAFGGCKSLKSISLPGNLSNIGPYAFEYCDSLESVTLPPNLLQIESFAFGYCKSLSSLAIPKSVRRISKSILCNCERLESLTVEDGNPVYDSRGGCNAIIETSSNKLIAGCQNSIPGSVTSIDEYAFFGMSLTEVSIPSSVSSIGGYAFNNCVKLSRIILSPSVTDISEFAFNNCSALEDVYCFWRLPLPSINPNNFFSNFFSLNATLHVPGAYVMFYEETSPWNRFKKIVPLNNDELLLGVNGIHDDNIFEIGRFTLDGQRVKKNHRGMAIIKYSDGIIKKTMVR